MADPDNEIRLTADQLTDARLAEAAREFGRRAGLKIVALPAGAEEQASPADLVISRALAEDRVTYELAHRLATLRGGRLTVQAPVWAAFVPGIPA